MKEKTPAASLHPGRVLEAAGGVYTIRLDTGEMVAASLRGRLKLESRAGDKVVAGDEVQIARDDSGATIESVAPRRSMLARRAPGRSRGAKVIVANPARLVAVFALARPAPNPRLLDRFLVTAEVNDLPAVIVANKSDLPEAAESMSLFTPYEAAGYTVIQTSVKSSQGLDELRAVLCDGTSVVTGPSGVGKSSLLNAIEPGLSLRIGEVMDDDVGKGRHTTVTSRLIPLGCGGYVADTPGIRELGLWEVGQAMLADAFPEFREPAESCRFAPSCSHSHEPGCGVLTGVKKGTIAESRHGSYLTLLAEIQEFEKKRY